MCDCITQMDEQLKRTIDTSIDDVLELLSDETQIAICVDLWDAFEHKRVSGHVVSLLACLLDKFEMNSAYTVERICVEDFPPYARTLKIEMVDWSKELC